MIMASTTAIQRDQVKTRDWPRVAVAIRAQDTSAFAETIKGDKIIHGAVLAAIKRNGRTLLRTLVKMSQRGLQRKVALRIDPPRRHLVHGLVEISIERG